MVGGAEGLPLKARRHLRPQTQFNNIERVYSRAIAFSNRKCSVPLESLLPNHCYVQRAHLFVQASLLDPVLLPPSHVSCHLGRRGGCSHTTHPPPLEPPPPSPPPPGQIFFGTFGQWHTAQTGNAKKTRAKCVELLRTAGGHHLVIRNSLAPHHSSHIRCGDPPNVSAMEVTACEACAGMGGTPRGRSSPCEPGDSHRNLTPKNFPK